MMQVISSSMRSDISRILGTCMLRALCAGFTGLTSIIEVH